MVNFNLDFKVFGKNRGVGWWRLKIKYVKKNV